jgi:hypothetical protein
MAKRRLPTSGYKKVLQCRKVPVGVADPSTCSHDASVLTKQLRRRHEKTWYDLPPSLHQLYIKVKVTLVQALRLCTDRTAHRGSRRIALLFHDQRHQKVMRGHRHAPAALYPRERPSTHCTGGWEGPRAGLDRCGKYRPTGIRSPDRPARSLRSSNKRTRLEETTDPTPHGDQRLHVQQ